MKILTKKQKDFILYRTIKIGNIYSFPSFGFNIYASPSYSDGAYLDTNPFTKSLAHTGFIVKEITNNGFARVNYTNKPHKYDFYLNIHEIENRDLILIILLFIITIIPLIIYNLFTGKYK